MHARCCRCLEGAGAYYLLSFRGSEATEESPGWFCHGNDALSQTLLSSSRSASHASDANPAKRIASEKEEQGSGRSFRRKAEAESSGLCDDAIPQMVPPW